MGDFWDRVRVTAARTKAWPPWMFAGITINPQHYVTYPGAAMKEQGRHEDQDGSLAEGDPLAEMRAHRDRIVAQERAATGQLRTVLGLQRQGVEEALAIAERTVLPALREALAAAATEKRCAESSYARSSEVATKERRTRERAESAEAALRALVEADAGTDAQKLQRAWKVARERVRK